VLFLQVGYQQFDGVEVKFLEGWLLLQGPAFQFCDELPRIDLVLQAHFLEGVAGVLVKANSKIVQYGSENIVFGDELSYGCFFYCLSKLHVTKIIFFELKKGNIYMIIRILSSGSKVGFITADNR
jgi:hypothetical protein